MSKAVEQVRFPATGDLEHDTGELTAAIERAKLAWTGRRIVFVGESHDSELDKRRRNDIVDHFGADRAVLIVTERAMKVASGSKLKYYAPQGIHEHKSVRSVDTDGKELKTQLKSSDPQRDRNVVEAMVKELSKDPSDRRAVVIVFGADHVQKMLNELELQIPGAWSWWYFPPVSDQLVSSKELTSQDVDGYTLFGFTDPPTLKDVEPQKMLFTRGQWLRPFSIDVRGCFAPPEHIKSGTVATYAVYTNDGVPLNQTVVKNMANTSKCSLHVAAINSIKLIGVSEDSEYQRLRKILLENA